MGSVGVQARAPTHPSSSSQPAYQRRKKPWPLGTLPVSEQTKRRSINCNTVPTWRLINPTLPPMTNRCLRELGSSPEASKATDEAPWREPKAL